MRTPVLKCAWMGLVLGLWHGLPCSHLASVERHKELNSLTTISVWQSFCSSSNAALMDCFYMTWSRAKERLLSLCSRLNNSITLVCERRTRKVRRPQKAEAESLLQGQPRTCRQRPWPSSFSVSPPNLLISCRPVDDSGRNGFGG